MAARNRSRRLSEKAAISSPFQRMRPRRVRSRPATILTKVLFPEPDAPVIATLLPASIDRRPIASAGEARSGKVTSRFSISSASMSDSHGEIFGLADAQQADEAGFRIRPGTIFQRAAHFDRLARLHEGLLFAEIDDDDIVGPVRVRGAEGAERHRHFGEHEELRLGLEGWRHKTRHTDFLASKALHLVGEFEAEHAVFAVEFVETQRSVGGANDRSGEGKRNGSADQPAAAEMQRREYVHGDLRETNPGR
ncbi:hypothetical protein RHECNPAF_3340079 [Rhizobium etli CNPAF512]|nr:hypothetical protein RHECNPAF_3340079 [Rhizobium etli CNPAF512]